MRAMRFLVCAAAALLIAAPGCGGPAKDARGGKTAKSDGGDAKTDGGDAKTEPEAKPEPKPAVVFGGDSPEDVVAKAKAAVDAEDLGALCNLMPEKERTGMVAMMGLMPEMMNMMKGMFAAFGGMAGGMAEGAEEDPEAAQKAKAEAEAKTAQMLKDIDAIIAGMKEVSDKHGVKMPPMSELGINPMGGASPKAEELADKVGDKLKGVNAAAYLTDMAKHFAKFDEVTDGKAGGGPVKDATEFLGDGALTDLAIEGDTATGKVNGNDANFVQENGRWFIKGLADK